MMRRTKPHSEITRGAGVVSIHKASSVRTLRFWLRGLLILLLAGIIWVVFIQWKIQSVPHYKLPAAADVGIVLGASLWNDTPSPGLRERLDLAVKLYHEGKFKQIIVSGGLDHNGSRLTEAEGMRNYLVMQDIPEADIWLEPEATSTYENLLFSKRIMDAEGFVTTIIMTHEYHGARSLDIAQTIGLKQPAVATTASKVMYMPYHEARETLAFSKWYWTKLMLKSGLMAN
ncbi:YdcF family protein [Paenibacillus eucommiae]|uniref:Uncharacterized SAM-binding protein YcdF (DUF218 family) n=1 Tax=Paenibacillus eucommiae TaxID=1355755 RepID=A0ABS4J5U9_9BACL|nr:YdcF family protein [Paenibacillus eucommiae]MBP1995198.1 uncharacterized SAM-binding protein YcdF (DUF218 family) [Paenibacillus eucommiae]